MPRGFVEIYAKQTTTDLFFCIEKMLKSGGFFIEHPDTKLVQIWNAEGDMIEMDRSEILLHVQQNELIIFWNNHYNDISVIFNQNSVVLFLDGFDTKETEGLFNLILTFTLLENNCNFDGFVFDRSEMVENIDWSEHLQSGKLIMHMIGDEFSISSQKIITTTDSIDFDVNNAYVLIRKTNDTFELSEMKQRMNL